MLRDCILRRNHCEIEEPTIADRQSVGRHVSSCKVAVRLRRLTGATAVTRLISETLPPERLDTKSSFKDL